ncbi:hypothetical protein [[Clostridium] colinum]|uniref:hypothetical protein n=1 Tax=[Clostridium] colinum TaxID=36835 RepID=UPI0020252767|nr:hypothetical protein [[Clostridium] colinum]
MNKIIKEYEENGKIVQEFQNGIIVKISKEKYLDINENELFKAQTIIDLEYIKCVLELQYLSK